MDLPEGRGQLLRMQEARLQKLREIGPVLAGSMAKRKNQAGYYLTDKVEGKTRTMHVSERAYEDARRWNENHKEAKRLLDELSEIQRALIKAEAKEARRSKRSS